MAWRGAFWFRAHALAALFQLLPEHQMHVGNSPPHARPARPLHLPPASAPRSTARDGRRRPAAPPPLSGNVEMGRGPYPFPYCTLLAARGARTQPKPPAVLSAGRRARPAAGPTEADGARGQRRGRDWDAHPARRRVRGERRVPHAVPAARSLPPRGRGPCRALRRLRGRPRAPSQIAADCLARRGTRGASAGADALNPKASRTLSYRPCPRS